MSDDRLKKDVGRITFPKVDSKMTRPDQEVKPTFSKTSKDVVLHSALNKINTFFGPYGMSPLQLDGTKELIQYNINNGVGTTFSANRKTYNETHTLNAGAHTNTSDSFVKEHEGLHLLVNHIAGKLKVSSDDIYKRLNSQLPADVRNLVASSLYKRGYDIESHKEYIPALRDALVNKEWRDEVLSSVPDSQRQSFHTRMKVAFRNVKDWAANSTEDDLRRLEKAKQILKDSKLNIRMDSLDKSKEIQMKEVRTKEDLQKDQDKDLQRKLQAYVEVAKHKYGRTPSLEEIMGLLDEVSPEQSKPKGSGDVQQVVMPVAGDKSLDKTDPTQEEAPGEPKILHLKVYFGMSKDKTGERKPDEKKILFYERPDGSVYDCSKQEWAEGRPEVVNHLNSRPLYSTDEDLVAAIANGVMDDEDYDSLEKAGLVSETPKKLWGLTKNLEDLMLRKSEAEELEKSLETEDDTLGKGEQPSETIETSEQGVPMTSGPGMPISTDFPGDDVFTEMLAVAMSEAMTGMEDQIRRIVREEIEGMMNELDSPEESLDEFGIENDEVLE